MVLDSSLLNTQQYKVRIKGKVEQSGEISITLPYTIEKGAFWTSSTRVTNVTYYFTYIISIIRYEYFELCKCIPIMPVISGPLWLRFERSLNVLSMSQINRLKIISIWLEYVKLHYCVISNYS